ncbi:alpha/beta hydrolase [Leclercia adecarboxylata]|uniref:alpha/beta fold hydrolase n=1 Tax=Leclercia adecarboxylata TaxID=83655 RepID=UPI002DBB8471|nr:alpha/beta hydrolase [Leclercia adecarboxylata]MEB6377394.1 alpha/beta hydrolase [Leclercia adecarboxylata]
MNNHALPLVLISGTLCNQRLWQPVLDRLNVSDARCITLTDFTSAPEAAQRLLSELPPRFLLAGFSLGAIVALQMVADAPQRIAGLALLSVNPLADPPENAASRREAVRAARQQGLANWLSASLWPKYVAPARNQDVALHDLICQMALECGSETLATQTEIAITRRDNRPGLYALACPITVINGLHDPLCTPSHHQRVAECAPQAKLVTLASAGHFTLLEAPDEVAPPLRHWIQECLHA